MTVRHLDRADETGRTGRHRAADTRPPSVRADETGRAGRHRAADTRPPSVRADETGRAGRRPPAPPPEALVPAISTALADPDRDVREAGEAALDRLDWRPLRAMGDPTDLPDAVGRMMTVGDDDANAAYYRVENLIFHNRHSGLDLTQAAEPVAALVLTAIRSGSWTPGGLVHGLDMLVEIVMGEPDATERARGNTRLVERCRAVVRAALPELYALVDRDEERILQGVIDLAAELEPDVGRRRWVYETVRGRIGRRVVLNSLRGLEQTLDPPPRETASDGAPPAAGRG